MKWYFSRAGISDKIGLISPEGREGVLVQEAVPQGAASYLSGPLSAWGAKLRPTVLKCSRIASGGMGRLK
jgi:hypothetical protein